MQVILRVVFFLVCTQWLYAADWLYISGVEPQKAPQIRLWGFIQVGYQKDYGDMYEVEGINKTPFVMLPPSLDTQSAFEVNRARLALRGKIDKANKFNFFLMSELGENGITMPAGHKVDNHLTDASVTYRAPYDINIRFGQFKYPTAEEALRAVFTSPYRNFTTATSQLLLERFLPNDAVIVHGNYQGIPEESVGAFRDRGVEVFHTFTPFTPYRISIAGMVGSGTGLSASNSSGKMTYYAYSALEYLFHKGKGYYEESLKTFVWYQDGKRRLNNQNYTRERYGVGVVYFHNALRLEVEYIKAKGMIYNGAVDTDPDPYTTNWAYKIAAAKENEADGGYFNIAYFLTKKIEVMTRYDYLNRLTNSTLGERDYKTTTFGISYHFQGVTRIDCNYALCSLKAPHNEAAQKVVANMGNLLSIQATLKF